MKSKEVLCEEIQFLKRRLIQISDEKGMNHPLNIQTSKNLEGFINEYMKFSQLK